MFGWVGGIYGAVQEFHLCGVLGDFDDVVGVIEFVAIANDYTLPRLCTQNICKVVMLLTLQFEILAQWLGNKKPLQARLSFFARLRAASLFFLRATDGLTYSTLRRMSAIMPSFWHLRLKRFNAFSNPSFSPTMTCVVRVITRLFV